MKKKKFGYLQVILMIGCIPLAMAVGILTVFAAGKMRSELIDSTYLRLKACSTSVEQYFTWDIRENIEQTLFLEDERFITSIIDKDGNRIEGTKADPTIWETVKEGND